MSETQGEDAAEPDAGAAPPVERTDVPRAAPDLARVDALADEITLLAGQIAAATARFLRLLAEFDDLGCWGGVGIRSLAHWLSFRAGMSLRTARDHVRVARALKDLPVTAAAFEAGELSFSKVRALTRVATSTTEESLVVVAKNSPAAHVERLVAGLRKVRPADPAWRRANPPPPAPDPGPDGDPHPEPEPEPELEPQPEREPERVPPRTMQWRWDEDTGDLVVWGRFGAADGRVVLAALTRAELERVRTTAHEEPAGPPDGVDGSGARSEAVDRTAPPPSDAGPALVALAGIGLTAQEAPVHAPAAEVLYLHRTGEDGSAEHRGPGPGTGVVSADDGPALESDAGHEVMCGSRSRCVLEGSDGAVLAYGRSRRLFSSTQLRALRLRDRSCRTPGCQRTRFLHAHHVVPWWEGGPTDLDNAILLCSSCHRAVHLGRLGVRTAGGQVFEFVDLRTGRRLDAAPAMFGRADHILENRTITPTTVTGGWWGEPLDLSLATATLFEQWRVQAQRLRHPWDDPTPPWDSPEEGLGQEAA